MTIAVSYAIFVSIIYFLLIRRYHTEEYVLGEEI